MQQALGLLSSGKASTLVACKLDRLSRSVADFVALLALAERQGWSLIVLDLGLDMSTPNGRFVATIMSSVAQLERELIAQRTREALQVKRSQGVRLGRPGRVPADVRAFILQERENGETMQSIADTLNDRGISTVTGAKWASGTVNAVLQAIKKAA